MRKIVEWTRNTNGRLESHFLNADDYTTNFTVTADGVTYRVRAVDGRGHLFVPEA